MCTSINSNQSQFGQGYHKNVKFALNWGEKNSFPTILLNSPNHKNFTTYVNVNFSDILTNLGVPLYKNFTL